MPLKHLVLLLVCVRANELVSTMIKFEKELYAMRDQVQKYYRDCDYTCLATASTTTADNKCAIDACSSSFYSHDNSGVEVTRIFGYPEVCGNCADQTQRYLDFKHSGVTNADIGYRTTSVTERQELACWTSQLDNDWVSNRNLPSLTWQYFGTPMGLHRTYPGYAQESCSSYDPRIRSWYVAATTGPKDVVIIVDTSGSMENADRMRLAREAAASVVSTLTILDRFNVVEFNTNSRALASTRGLVRGTDENKQKAITAISELQPSGRTFMENAFDHAFQLIEQSITNEATTGCHKVILFLTDGEPSAGKVGSALENHVRDLNKDFQAAIFTYSLGSGAAQDLPKNIACQNDGIWTPVEDGATSLRTQMSYYYDYIASLRDTDTNVVWVEPYIDAFGAGRMTTAALAVYDNVTTPPILLGVLGMDITVKEMELLEPNHETFLQRFITRSAPRCPTLKSLSVCAMETLRQKDYATLDPEFSQSTAFLRTSYNATCTESDCPTDTQVKVCEDTVRSSPWCPSKRGSFQAETCVETCAAFHSTSTHLSSSLLLITSTCLLILITIN